MKKKRGVLTLALAGLVALVFYAGLHAPNPSSQQIVSKLESPEITVIAPPLVLDQPVADQVETPARAAQYATITMTDAEREELAAIVFLEAGNQSADGQQAVVEVVFNRVLHSGFPNTVHDVLHQGEDSRVPQFSTIYRIGEVSQRKSSMRPSTQLCMETRFWTSMSSSSPVAERTIVSGAKSAIMCSAVSTFGGDLQ